MCHSYIEKEKSKYMKENDNNNNKHEHTYTYKCRHVLSMYPFKNNPVFVGRSNTCKCTFSLLVNVNLGNDRHDSVIYLAIVRRIKSSLPS